MTGPTLFDTVELRAFGNPWPEQHVVLQESHDAAERRLAGYDPDSGAPYSETGTSKDAAHEIAPETMKKRGAQVLAVIRSYGARGAACFEIARTMGLPQHWLTSTIAALGPHGSGEIRKSPRKVLNPESGKECVLLICTRSH